MPEESTTCAVKKGMGFGYRVVLCGKPAKGNLTDGTPACGLHIGVEKRVAANREHREREQAGKRDEWRAAGMVVDRLHSVGIEASVDSDGLGHPAGFIITNDVAEALMARLAGLDA